MTDRNPDIVVNEQDVPKGCYIEPGNYLMRYARLDKIPYGVAREKLQKRASTGSHYRQFKTVGLVIREEDRDRMRAVIDRFAVPT